MQDRFTQYFTQKQFDLRFGRLFNKSKQSKLLILISIMNISHFKFMLSIYESIDINSIIAYQKNREQKILFSLNFLGTIEKRYEQN